MKISASAVLPAALCLAAYVAGGCRSAEPAGDSLDSSVSDSAGVRIVFNAVPQEIGACRIGFEPKLEIGSTEEDDGELLYRVNDAAMLPGGRIAVVHGSTDNVRVYDSTGTFETALGRSGAGPGEFNNPLGIFTRPDGEFWVGDMSPFRFNVFRASLEFDRSVAPHPPLISPPMEQGMIADGRVILGHWRMNATPEFEPDSIRLHVYDADGGRIDTLGAFVYGSMGHVSTEMSPIWAGRIFESRTRMAAAGDRVAIAHSAIPEIRIHDSDMTLRSIIRWEPPRNLEVTSDDTELYYDDIRQRYSDESDRDAQSQDFMRQLISPERPVSDYFPAFNRMEFGKDERLWVQTYSRPADTTDTWMIFGTDGRYVCTATMPVDFSVFETGADYILGRYRDPEAGIELVRIYDLEAEE